MSKILQNHSKYVLDQISSWKIQPCFEVMDQSLLFCSLCIAFGHFYAFWVWSKWFELFGFYSENCLFCLYYAEFWCFLWQKVIIWLKTIDYFFCRWFAPHLEIFRGIGVIAYYIVKLWDKDGILPNRIFMISFFTLSTILWIAYAIRSVNF